ncbi:pilus assembly PilX family protein [Aquabacterium sp.]|uniref:pilus assembly PilX family protein n=1 Tax=Aquabacterium sp. TaxID=1872578 RepID=UPI003D6D6227
MRQTQTSCASRSRQRGLSLLFALMSLVALSLASLALVRSVDTSSMVLGNLGFKQDATAIADQATRNAITWLNTSGADLNKDSANEGYYAQVNDDVDVIANSGENKLLVNWDLDGCKVAQNMPGSSCKVRPHDADTINGATTNYVIFRLCSTAIGANDTGNSCAKPLNSTNSKVYRKGRKDYSDYEDFNTASGVYYRIVVRVIDARQTTSFVETIVHL